MRLKLVKETKSLNSFEKKRLYEEEKSKINFDTAEEAVKRFREITKSNTRTINNFDKETLKTYLQNVGNYEQQLRNVSRYLYYRSQVYQKLIKYCASMFCLNARRVIPSYDLTKENDKTKTLKSYYDTLLVLDKMNIQAELIKAVTICFREDVFYGCYFYDDSGGFVFPLDPDYCRISGQYQTGDYAFAFNMAYFNSRQQVLEYLGEPFTTLKSQYDSTGEKWQDFPEENAICLKFRSEDWDIIVPPFSALFLDLISLLDLADIQAVSDEQLIYQLFWIKLDTLNNSDIMNDWKIDPKLVNMYYDKFLAQRLPEYSTSAIIPGELNKINFEQDQSTDVNRVEKATQAVLNTAGGAQILNSASISGTTAFNAAVKSDTEYAISTLLPQIEGWVNRFISYQVSNPSKVKFFEVSEYTRKELKEDLLKSGQYGLPNSLAINSLDGMSELDTLALNFLENDCLNLHEKFIPMSSSYTQSGSAIDNIGRPKESDNTITDDGEASRDKTDKKKG